MLQEKWLPVVGLERRYEVSSLGKIRSIRRNLILRPSTSKDGYKKVSLHGTDRKHYLRVHRVVAEAFIPNPLHKPQINHINGVKRDNFVENLEWSTASENTKHAFLTGLLKPVIPPSIKNDPVKSKRVIQLSLSGKVVQVWPSLSEAGRHGFNFKNISEVCNNRRNKADGYLWRFVDKC